jgi:hemolysin activation/secretion protein
VSGRNVDYGQKLDNPAPLLNNLLDYDGDIQRVQASSLIPLMASSNSRWLLDTSADYTHRRYRETTTDTLLQSQEYASLQLASFYVTDFQALQKPLDLSVGITLRKGLGSNHSDEATVASDLGYLSVRPELRAKWRLAPQWQLRVDALGQYSGNTLPEEEQWVLGGLDGVQAYLPGVAVGDSGAMFKLNLEKIDWQIGAVEVRPGVFGEYGYADFHHAVAGVDQQSLADIGVALTAKLHFFEASISAAEPLYDHGIDQSVIDDSRSRFLFRLKAGF